jgi:hypothetical protein
MKGSPFPVLKFGAIYLLSVSILYATTNAPIQHRFHIDQYDQFHAILHPLQHEALPQGDFQRIRSMANELVTRGKAIVMLKIPDAPKDDRRKFAKKLKEFDQALVRFKTNAKSGNNTRLRKSYMAVHDSFEKLADLVPSVYPGGDPPILFVSCPSSKVEGSELKLTADIGSDDQFLFSWIVEPAKILSGQGTASIVIDTSGLAGQRLKIIVEANDGSGHVIVASCVIEILPNK